MIVLLFPFYVHFHLNAVAVLPLHSASGNVKNRIKNECTNVSVAVRLYRINAGAGKTVRAELKGKCDDKKIVFPPLFASNS